MNIIYTAVAQAIIILFSISVHEAAHAWTADKMGDPTARYLGRVTLNPIKHIDLIGTVIVPLILILTRAGILFGWAKPVPINPDNFYDRKKGEILTSIAGPMSNLLLAFIVGTILRILLRTSHNEVIFLLLFNLFAINVILAFFNLIPIPPLDGSHILANMLSPRARAIYQSITPFAFIFIIIFMGVISPILMMFLRLLAYIIIGVRI